MIKLVVWDLDGTVWRGTLAEGDAPEADGRAVNAILAAREKGVLQSVASRNDRAAALRALGELKLDGLFLCPRIEPLIVKHHAIRETAARFNIALDGVAFVDDEPFELYEASRYLPGVKVYHADDIDALINQINELPAPSGDRYAWMKSRETLLAAEQSFSGTRAEFLRECNMRLLTREAGTGDLHRITELANRANKLNNLSKTDGGRLTESAAAAYIENPERFAFVCELSDIFGQHGIVGACLLTREAPALSLDLFCVSCRVEGRGIAAAFLNEALIMCARNNAGLTSVRCRCADGPPGTALLLFKSSGFSVIDRQNGTALLELTLPFKPQPVPWINFAQNE